MPTIKEWIQEDVNDKEDRLRQIGRYYASEAEDIISGKLKPKDFFKKKKIDREGSWNISWGVGTEKWLTEILQKRNIDCEFQQKRELKIGKDIVISCKADFLFPDYLLEMKVPLRQKTEISPYNKAQLELYWRAFEKPVYIMYFCRDDYRIFLYEPNGNYWEMIQDKIIDFHQQLLSIPKGRI